MCTLITVPPLWPCVSSGAGSVTNKSGARRRGGRPRKQLTHYEVAEKLRAAAFRLAAKWICNYFIYFNKIKLKPTELGLLISVRAQWGNKNGHSLWTHNYWRQKWSPALLSIIKMLINSPMLQLSACSSKVIIDKVKRPTTIWENTFALHVTDERLVTRIYGGGRGVDFLAT